MKKVLIVVTDDEARTRNAVARALATTPAEAVDMHLLAVQPKVTSHVAAFFGSGELRKLQEQGGRELLEPIEKMLDAAGVRYTSHVKVGRSAETVAGIARELRCERVVCGPDTAGTASRVFGSLAQQVRHLMAGSRDCEVIGS